MVLEKAFRIENSVIVGFLYNKLQEVERAGVEVRYKVELERGCPIPEIQLVEVMGILFDHTMITLAEAELAQKKIYFKLKQEEEEVEIRFAYTSESLSDVDMGGLRSKKEKEDDLYRLRHLIEENGGKMLVKMKTIEDVSYLCIKTKLLCNA